MSRQRVNSSNFNQPILSKYDYCSDPLQHFSSRCSLQGSQISHQVRRNAHIASSHSKMQPQLRNSHNKNRCCSCGIPEDLQYRHEYFYEERCKMYYCHPCILIFYKKYCSMINDFQKQFGKAPEMQVELRCGCEIQTRIILKYATKYCFDCSELLQGRQLFLKNQCKIMEKCYLSIKLANQRPISYQEKIDKLRIIWKEISGLIVTCENCNDLIDGQNIGGLIGQTYLCESCIKISKQAEQIYSKRRLQKQYSYKSLEIKRQDKPQGSKGSMYLSFFQQKQPIKCKICHIKIKQPIQRQQICRNCFIINESRRRYGSIQRSSEKQIIKHSQNRKKVIQQFQNHHARQYLSKTYTKRKIQNPQRNEKQEDFYLSFPHIRPKYQKEEKKQRDMYKSQELQSFPSGSLRDAKKEPPKQNIKVMKCLSCKRSFPSFVMEMGKMKNCDFCVMKEIHIGHGQDTFKLQLNNLNDSQEHQRPSFRQKPNRSYRPMSQRQKKEQFDSRQCKLCFNAQSTMINIVCSHVLMCQKCYILCKTKSGSSIIQCPLCKTLGEYCQYVTPIYS